MLFDFFEDKGLPADIIYYNAAADIPYFRTKNYSQYTGTSELRHLLLEALLYRKGYTESVYIKQFYIDNPVTLYKNLDINTIENFYFGRQDDDITDFMGAEFPELTESEKEIIEEFFSGSAGDTDSENFSVINKQTEYIMDLGAEGNPPYYLLCDAAAYCFAGVPEERHYEAFVNNFDSVNKALKIRFAATAASSPSNGIQSKILEFLSENEDPDVRTIIFQSYRNNRLFPDHLDKVLTSSEETAYNRYILIRAAGDAEDRRNGKLLTSLLEDENRLISVTAAGEILHLHNPY
jgi:hypothetical protein